MCWCAEDRYIVRSRRRFFSAPLLLPRCCFANLTQRGEGVSFCVECFGEIFAPCSSKIFYPAPPTSRVQPANGVSIEAADALGGEKNTWPVKQAVDVLNRAAVGVTNFFVNTYQILVSHNEAKSPSTL